MASDIREALTEEIALEGLDGITISTLWIRLRERRNFTFSLDDSSKCYLWNCVLNLQGMEYYRLSKPRPDLIPYNRFHYIDPETKHFLETEHIPDDIYPIKFVEEEGVFGSCSEYSTRKSITEKIKSSKPSLAEVNEGFGSTFVIVASKMIRLRALIGQENDQDFVFDKLSFCILERIGRSRYNGQASFGKQSLQVFQESPKTLYYMLKKLRRLNMLTKQRLFVVKKPTNVKITCLLYHLNKFYQEVGNRVHDELMNLAAYLSTKPDCTEEANKARADLKLYDMFKKVSQHTMRPGDRSFEFIDVPWRDRYPDAKPQEYLQKNHRTEKRIRVIRMTTTVDELQRSLKTEFDKESDDEDEEDVEEPADSAPILQFRRVFDEPQLYQVMKLINQTGSKGVSQISLQNIMGASRLVARRVLKFLLKMKYITMVLEDRGRQKTIMYVDVENVQQNEAHQSVQEEMKKFQNVSAESTPHKEPQNQDKSSKSGKGKARKEMPLISFSEEEPSEEKVSEIREELGRIDDGQQRSSMSPMKLTPKQEIIQEIQQESGVKVVIEELTPTEIKDKKTGALITGMKRFGYMLTESHVRRANWILEVIGAIKVVESFIILRLLRNREKEMNLTINMDQKSLKRLVDALAQEGRLRSYKAIITMGHRTREFTFLCSSNITSSDETLLRMIEEAKLRYFSVSREELRNRNLLRKAQAKAESSAAKDVKMDDIPKSAQDTIRSHQEHRRKLAEKMPVMKYDRKAGLRYGLLPKMLRFQTAHEYLFYLSYDTHGLDIKYGANHSNEDVDMQVKTENEGLNGAEFWKGEDRLDVAEGMSEQVENEPQVYSHEMTWRRYLPPVPAHSGYPKGWVLLSDCLLIMPVCMFCEVVNVCYNIEGLDEILRHPQKRYYPVINLPFTITQQLLHSKKYVHAFSTVCAYLSEMGLLSFGREVLKKKDQCFIYLHQNAALLDTRDSLPGYNKTRAPEGVCFPLKTFHFDYLVDLQHYWEYVRLTACNSNLSCKSMVHADLEDDKTYEVKSLKQASAAYSPNTVEDDGALPGDQRGGAGLDSSLFSHAVKNWSYSGCQNPPRQYRKYSLAKGLKGGMDIESKKEVVENYNKTQLKGKDRLVLSDNPNKHVALKKVTREKVKGNRGGKGVTKRRVHTEVTKTHKIISRMEGKVMKKRCIKLQSSMKKKMPQRKKPFEKGDEKDKDIYRERCKLRVMWTAKEDSVLLMCRLASLIMDNRKKISLISYMKVRDYLHEKCGAVSNDKTSQAVQRRIKFVLKNPQTESNFLLYYREAMQDEYVLTNFVSKEFILTDEDLVPNFRKLVDYLLDKFKSLDLQKCSLPDNLEDLRKNYTIQYIGKLTPHKLYSDVNNKADICQDVLRNILHSAVLLQDKQGRTHEMFKLLSQYPDPLLSAVVKELRADGLFVINKKNHQRESVSQLQTGMGLRNFKVSQRYLYQYKHSYLSAMFEESAAMWTQVCDKHLYGKGEDEILTLPLNPKSGECAMLIPLILNRWLDIKITMPQELVIVDMEGFYKFPWGRGKNTSSYTKGDKVLQDLKVPLTPKETQSEAVNENLNEEDERNGSQAEAREKTDGVQNIDGDKENGDDIIGVQDIEKESEKKCDGVKSIKLIEDSQGKREGVQDFDTGKGIGRKSVGNQDKDVASDKVAGLSEKDSSDVNDRVENNQYTATNEKNKVADKDMSGDCTRVCTNHTTVIIPNAESLTEQASEQLPGTVSGFASRTLLSLRRAEDCSFDEIRIFNAQDNFVVKSCEIGVKIRGNFEEGKAGNPTVEHLPGNQNATTLQSENKKDGNDKGEDSTDVEKAESGQREELHAEKLERISRLFLDKGKIRNIHMELQRLLPFKINVEDIWSRFKSEGVSEDDLKLYQNVFQVIEGHGDLGVRMFDLNKQFEEGYPWRQAVNVLIHHTAPPGVLMIHQLHLSQNRSQYSKKVLKVGVTCTRYVSLNNARPWVIHAYRNIKGRGLHVDEDAENTVPIEKVDESQLTTSIPDLHPYLYTEPAESKGSSGDIQNSKKRKLEASEKVRPDDSTCKDDKVKSIGKRILPLESSIEAGIDEKSRRLDQETLAAVKEKATQRNKKSTITGDEPESTPNKCDNEIDNSTGVQNTSVGKLDGRAAVAETSKTVDTGNVKDANDEDVDNEETGENKGLDSKDAKKSTETNAENVEGMQTRRSRKRKVPEEAKKSKVERAPAISTYDKVRLVIQPWRKPEGSINKPILKMMMESVMLYLMMNPGSPEDALVKRYAPYLQPMILRYIVDILEDIGCVTRQYIKKRKTTLFSKLTLPQIGIEEDEDATALMVPAEDCVIKMGLFGQEIFPNTKWPENTHHQKKSLKP